jgi:S1-C subfamily serine protease
LIDNYNKNNVYKIKGLIGDQLNKKYSSKKGESYVFKLVFPKIPSGIELLTLRSIKIDPYNGTTYKEFEIDGIKISNPKFYSKSNWNETSLKNYLINESIDTKEGIYERVVSGDNKYKIGVVKSKNGYEIIYLNSSSPNDFTEGDHKAFLTNTASQSIYQTKWVMSDRSIDNDCYTTFSPSFMEVDMTDGSGKHSYLKLFPSSTDITKASKKTTSSGTGFLISTNGYIVTNHHVIEDANEIQVRGINGDFNKIVKAKIFLDDVNNDLTILKTNDSETPNITELPYIISNKLTDPGSTIFCLGFPLRATMGDEVKITNGIISSSSGFKGDISSYQISAPVQPGNSGGPLFDDKGNIIGIINAKHLGTENVSYAIKSIYLNNLINSYPNQIQLPKNNKISDLSLSEKIKSIKKYTLIIETK